jgi:hypothetical protein
MTHERKHEQHVGYGHYCGRSTCCCRQCCCPCSCSCCRRCSEAFYCHPCSSFGCDYCAGCCCCCRRRHHHHCCCCRCPRCRRRHCCYCCCCCCCHLFPSYRPHHALPHHLPPASAQLPQPLAATRCTWRKEEGAHGCKSTFGMRGLS